VLLIVFCEGLGIGLLLSSGFHVFPGVCSLNANVSENSVCSIYIGEYLLACVDGTECDTFRDITCVVFRGIR
jgi:hypothetical protein